MRRSLLTVIVAAVILFAIAAAGAVCSSSPMKGQTSFRNKYSGGHSASHASQCQLRASSGRLAQFGW